MLYFILGLLVGILIAIIVFAIYRHNITCGDIFSIENDDSESQPYLFLELHRDPRYVLRCRYVIFKMKHKNEPPQ